MGFVLFFETSYHFVDLDTLELTEIGLLLSPKSVGLKAFITTHSHDELRLLVVSRKMVQ